MRAFGRVLGLSKKHLAGEQSSSLARGFPAGLRWCSCRSREVWAGKQTAKPPTKARKLDSRRDFTREAKSRARAEPVFGFGCSRTVHDNRRSRSKNRRLVKSVRELAFQLSQKSAAPPVLETSSARRRLFLPLQQNTSHHQWAKWPKHRGTFIWEN